MKKLAFIFILAVALGTPCLAQNYKIKQVMTMSGQKIESTVYVKGARKRTESGGYMGMGADVANIEQCDMRRNVQVNDKKKLYFIEPFADSTETTTTTNNQANRNTTVTKGGTVTITSTITDTGERKQMFGLTARHIKTTMTMESSPDACSKQNMTMETDGWYVDLPQFSCPMQVPRSPMMPNGGGRGGCVDKTIVKQSGTGKLGFPLMETRTMSMDGSQSFTQTVETLEFSKATLEDALFDIPAGYTLAKSSQDLYGRPDFTAMQNNQTSANQNNQTSTNTQTVSPTKKPGMIRIGVVVPTNKSGENVSTTNLQMFLIQKLTGGNVEAVAVGNEADAKSLNCDYILTSDFSKLKQSTGSKIGGILGKVTNTDSSATKNYEAQVDFKLVSLKDGKTVTQNKAANKSENNADRAAEAVLAQEAQTILSSIK